MFPGGFGIEFDLSGWVRLRYCMLLGDVWIWFGVTCFDLYEILSDVLESGSGVVCLFCDVGAMLIDSD